MGRRVLSNTENVDKEDDKSTDNSSRGACAMSPKILPDAKEPGLQSQTNPVTTENAVPSHLKSPPVIIRLNSGRRRSSGSGSKARADPQVPAVAHTPATPSVPLPPDVISIQSRIKVTNQGISLQKPVSMAPPSAASVYIVPTTSQVTTGLTDNTMFLQSGASSQPTTVAQGATVDHQIRSDLTFDSTLLDDTGS